MIIPYFDAHCDTLSYCLRRRQSLYWNTGQLDLRRLEAFDPVGQVFAIFVNSKNVVAEELDQQVRAQRDLYLMAKKE